MHKSVWKDTEDIVNAILQEWLKIINLKPSEIKSEDWSCSFITFANDQMNEQKIKIAIDFGNPVIAKRKQITLYLLNSESEPLYEIKMYDNTKESLKFAIDSIFDYANSIVGCHLTGKVNS